MFTGSPCAEFTTAAFGGSASRESYESLEVGSFLCVKGVEECAKFVDIKSAGFVV